MSGEQIRLQLPPKLFGVNSWITQMIQLQAEITKTCENTF